MSRSRTKGSNNGSLNNTGDAQGGEGCRVKSLSPPCSFSIHVKFHTRSGRSVERPDGRSKEETRFRLDHRNRLLAGLRKPDFAMVKLLLA